MKNDYSYPLDDKRLSKSDPLNGSTVFCAFVTNGSDEKNVVKTPGYVNKSKLHICAVLLYMYINLTFICTVYTKKNDIMYRINMRVMHCMILHRGALIQTGNFWYDSDIVNQCCGSRSGSGYGRIGIILADPDPNQPKIKLNYIFSRKFQNAL
jgi:hypothetical protein